MVSTRFNSLVILLTNIRRAFYSFHSDGSIIFSQHSVKSETNLNHKIECGVGPRSRRNAHGFGIRIEGGSDANILNVSANLWQLFLNMLDNAFFLCTIVSLDGQFGRIQRTK